MAKDKHEEIRRRAYELWEDEGRPEERICAIGCKPQMSWMARTSMRRYKTCWTKTTGMMPLYSKVRVRAAILIRLE